ncbi:MAG: glycosyltransferase family 9 protein [Ignavibacteriae bacterium]|nr:glycosyltransferase family 9 protein [Ignavibacteriota bacterium]
MKKKTVSGKVLVISLHKLGDTIFTIPAIKLLNKKHSAKNVKILCYPESKTIYKRALDNEIITLQHTRFFIGGRIAKVSAVRLFRKIKSEIIIDLTGNIKSASLLFFNTAGNVLGFNKNIYQSLYSDFRMRNEKAHLVEALIEIVDKTISSEEVKKIAEYKLTPKVSDVILIHPHGGWSAKEWNLTKFIEIAEKLISEKNKKVKFVFEKNEKYQSLKNKLTEKKLEFIETESIEHLFEEIDKCFLLIGNDSGPVYMAAMAGKPTFSIYGPTNPSFSIPFGKHHTYIRKIIHCSPKEGEQYCYTFAGRKGCPSFECMNQLTVDEVYNKLSKFLQSLNTKVI